jgi:hypothetical protein
MYGRETVLGGYPFTNFRIVLHSTGAERIQVIVHAEVHTGEGGEVADYVKLGELAEVEGRCSFAAVGDGAAVGINNRHIAPGEGYPTAAGC